APAARRRRASSLRLRAGRGAPGPARDRRAVGGATADLITPVATRSLESPAPIDHLIEITRAAAGTWLDVGVCMQTIQVSIGEILEAVYDELVEAYGDKELALIAAQALADHLLAETRPRRPVERAA